MIEKLTIIGVGLIGGSLARALREAEHVREIVGYGRSVGSLQQAVELGVIDRAEVSLTDAARDADIVVLASPIGAMPEILTALKPVLNDRIIVTDVGSVKGDVISAARHILGAHFARFVPGHPLAGTEQSGVAASLADLFQRRRVILTPESETDSAALARVRAMWEIAGAQTVTMSAEEHDRILATSSHLPHMLAYCLVDMVVRHDDYRAIMECAAGGFRDTTRIAASDAVMWRDICLANREALLAAMRQYQEDFSALIAAIEKGDGAALLQTFTRAKHVRDSLNKKL
ncbi:MAG: prephenate dehydrogenase/arogenate dehydrogenase family protein [Gammaproteobacteria bacterium]|nr:prephenate dehydrogenase/arogenate dehydrogenase family protein [Gammaproteobacteria bacterium]